MAVWLPETFILFSAPQKHSAWDFCSENRPIKIRFYFKFPPAFKVHFPKVIGNYNPDWGIVRYDETGKLIQQLIRETKGTQDEKKLQFPQERRKIECARKYFKALRLDYRHITANTPAWWLPDDVQQASLGV